MALIQELFLIIIIFTLGCSSLHTHRNLFYEKSDEVSLNQVEVERKKAIHPTRYYDDVTLNLGSAKIELAVIPEEVYGTVLAGPIFVPFFPVFWRESEITYLQVFVKKTTDNPNDKVLLPSTMVLSINDGMEIKPSKVADSGGILFGFGRNCRRFVFDFEKKPFPAQIKIRIADFENAKGSQPPITLSFKKDSYWHYVWFVFMHTD